MNENKSINDLLVVDELVNDFEFYGQICNTNLDSCLNYSRGIVWADFV